MNDFDFFIRTKDTGSWMSKNRNILTNFICKFYGSIYRKLKKIQNSTSFHFRGILAFLNAPKHGSLCLTVKE